MRCPKCGYNSFEYLDSCKKCSTDLIEFKASHGLRAAILPLIPSEEQVLRFEEPPTPQPETASGPDDYDFQPDLGGDNPVLPQALPSEPDPFSFGLDLTGDQREAETETIPPESGPSVIIEEGEEDIDPGSLFGSTEGAACQTGTETAPDPEETFSGEFSFDETLDELSREQQPLMTADVPATDGEETAADWPQATNEFSFDELEYEIEERPSEGITAEAAAEIADPFAFGEVLLQESAEGGEAGKEEIDTLGLSMEEYESLFGELPQRKKEKTDQPG